MLFRLQHVVGLQGDEVVFVLELLEVLILAYVLDRVVESVLFLEYVVNFDVLAKVAVFLGLV